MKPAYWGREGWHFLNTVAFRYPVDPTHFDRQQYAQFFNSLRTVLPCPEGAHHLKMEMEKDPIEDNLDSRASLVKWLYRHHDKVNKLLGKPSITFDQYVEFYRQMKTPDWRESADPKLYLAAAVGGGVLVYVLLRSKIIS